MYLFDGAGVVDGHPSESPEARWSKGLVRWDGCRHYVSRSALVSGGIRGRGRNVSGTVGADVALETFALLLAFWNLEPERPYAIGVHETWPRRLRVDLEH